MPSPLPLAGLPGLGRAVLGEAHPGEPPCRAGDFRCPGEADGDRIFREEEPISWGDFMEAEEGVPAPEAGGRGGLGPAEDI